MKKYFSYVLLTFISVSVFPVFAVESNGMQAKELKQQGIVQKKQEIVENKCAISESKIKTLVANYENNKTSWQNLIANTEEVLTKISEKLKNAGSDTTKLNEYIATLKTMMEKASADKDSVIAKLKEGQSLACGASNGEYKLRLQEARQLRLTLVEDRKAARQYFINTVKPEIKRLRELLNNKTTTVEE